MPTQTVTSTARTAAGTRPSSSTAPVQFRTPSGIPRPIVSAARESSPVFHTPSNRPDTDAPSSHAEGPGPVSEPDTRSTATVRENLNDSPSHNSLFSQPSVTAEEIFNETNRAAVNRGKKPMPTLRVDTIELNPNDELTPDDSHSRASSPDYSLTGWSQKGSHCLPSIQSHASREIESRVRSYFSDTSDIPEQDIVIDGNTNRIHHVLCPELSEPATPIEDAEIAKLRALYPEPFSENDPNPSRRPPKYAPVGFTGAIPELSGMGVASGSGNTANFRRFTNDSGGSDRNRSQSGFRDIPPHLMRNNGGAGGNPNDPDPSDHGGPPSDSDDDAGSERTNDYGSEDEGNPGDLNL
ncbi:hypothetical protein L218DRAFT_1004328 [Marasmius fiardii PR-910]|nr:hypothetical protein L218DRAFT_1004328 [Marasmius fiardii PR-910]